MPERIDSAHSMGQQTKTEFESSISDVTPSPVLFEQDAGGFLETLILLAKYKFGIVYFVLGAALFSLLIVFLLPKYYTANAKILPPQQEPSVSTALLSQLGQIGGFISSSGIGQGLGLHDPNDMYISMLRSRTVTDDLIDRFALMELYHKKFRVDARKELNDRTQITSGKDEIISISVEDRSPARASQMANAYVEELGKLTRTLAVTDAAKRRLFFEQQVKSANEQLAAAEVALKRTEETTGIIQLDSQAKVMLQGYADLRAQIAEKEVEVQSMQSFAAKENPDLIRAEQELTALRGQLAQFQQGKRGEGPVDLALEKVPSAGLEYVRKLREVKYREALFDLLTKQYEAARIDEARDSAIVQVLDPATAPERKSWPKRGLIVEVVTLLALLLAVPGVHLAELLRRMREEPQSAAQWQLLKTYLFRGRRG